MVRIDTSPPCSEVFDYGAKNSGSTTQETKSLILECAL